MNIAVCVRGVICAGLLWAAFQVRGETAAPAPELLCRIHFAGTDRLDQEPNAAKLKAISNLSASRTLREQVLRKLSAAPQQLYQLRLTGPQPDRSDLFRPLWEDLIAHESVVEVRGLASQPLEWTVAVRLSDDRARVWSTNLWQTMEAWSAGRPVAGVFGGAAGWEVKKHRIPNLLRWVKVHDWIVVGLGQDQLVNHAAMVKALQNGRQLPQLSQGAWLEVKMDLPVMAHWWLPAVLAGISPRQLPVVELACSSQGDSIRTQGALKFAQSVPLQLEAWRFPTNSVRDPLVAFTAVQGIRGSWNDSHWTQTFEMKPAPNQIFIWSQAKLPFLTFAACPATDVTNSLRKASATLPALVMSSLGAHKTGKIVFNASRSEISWTELPLFHPFLEPAVEPNGQFLLGGTYPSMASNPPPQELIAQVVGRTNLVYYDWEITQERLAQESIVLPLMNAVLAAKLKLDFGTERTNSYIQPWLKALGPLLGNTITEATTGSNREIAFVRRSHLGLTSLELVCLAHWLDDPGFPLFGYALPLHDKAPTPAGGGGQTSKRP